MSTSIVLCYHAVGEPNHPMVVSADALEWQVSRLLRRGYVPLSLAELTAGSRSSNAFAVTFDDGFRSVREHAFPVLRALDVVATIFPTTRFVTEQERLDWPGLDRHGALDDAQTVAMSPQDVRELVAAGWDVGSHGYSHRALPGLPDEALRLELRRSREECEQLAGTACRSVAYPFGAVDRRVVECAREAGYTIGAGLSWTSGSADPMCLPRIAVYARDGRRRFSTKTCAVAHRAPLRQLLQVRQRVRESREEPLPSYAAPVTTVTG